MVRVTRLCSGTERAQAISACRTRVHTQYGRFTAVFLAWEQQREGGIRLAATSGRSGQSPQSRSEEPILQHFLLTWSSAACAPVPPSTAAARNAGRRGYETRRNARSTGSSFLETTPSGDLAATRMARLAIRSRPARDSATPPSSCSAGCLGASMASTPSLALCSTLSSGAAPPLSSRASSGAAASGLT